MHKKIKVAIMYKVRNFEKYTNEHWCKKMNKLVRVETESMKLGSHNLLNFQAYTNA
jgi:hypothetical protein